MIILSRMFQNFQLRQIMEPRSELRQTMKMYHKYKLEELDEKMTEVIS